ncbi:MAG: hypothetical protein HY075_02850 [Deltaproteobacteria bacterium]|nr:hypothetical protein [Deltaproteobacteria bacterium]
MRFWIQLCGVAAVASCALSPSTSSADLKFRYDFEGGWRSTHGGIYEIYQNGESSATMSVKEQPFIDHADGNRLIAIPSEHFSLLFGREAEIPSSYIQNLKARDIGGVHLDILKAGTYNAALKVTDAGSEIDGVFETDLAIGDYEFTLTGNANAFVPKKEKFEKCEGVYRPRAITVSLSGLSLKDKTQVNDPGFVKTVRNFMLSLGLRVGLSKVTYSDSLIKVDPHPVETAKTLEKCSFLDDEYPAKSIPSSDESSGKRGEGKVPAL